ncbi:MAG: ABC transporter permease [Actinomycetota bacterium]
MSEPDDDLIELGGTIPLGLYLRELWQRREFAIVVPANDVRAQNMDTVLGQAWHLVNPIFLVGVYYVIFGVILSADRGVANYLAFLVVGVLLFQLTQRVVQDSAMTIQRNEGLIRTLQFPRALLPVSALVGQTIAFIPALVVLFGLLLVTGEWPRLTWLLLPAVLVAQSLIGLGGAFVVSRLGFVVRDVQQILPHLFRLLFYMSGVLFVVDEFVEDEFFQRLFALNPMYDVITVARWSLLGTSLPAEVLIGTVLWALVLPISGLLFFRAGERHYGG